MNVVVSKPEIVHDGNLFDAQADRYVDTYSVVIGHTAVVQRAKLNDAWYAVDRLTEILTELGQGAR